MALTKATYSMIENAPANVRDFGAIGDGTTDDTAAIQSALDSGTSRVFIPAGSYKITTLLSVPSDIEVCGEGTASSIVLGADTVALELNGTSNIHLRDFAIDGQRATYTSNSNNAIFIEWRVTAGSSVRIESVYVHDVAGAGIIGLAAVGTPSSEVYIENCRVENTGTHGIILQDYISDVVIRRNTVKASGLGFADRPAITASRYGKNVIVSDNICVGSVSALGTSVHGISIDRTENATCVGNIISDQIGYGIEIGGVTNGTFQGNSINACSRAAIGLSGSETLTLRNVNVSVVGNVCNANTTQGIYTFMTSGTGVYFHESIVISSNTVNGTTTSSGIEIGFVNRLTVSNNSVYDSFLSGVYVDNCKEINITGNNLINNNCTAIKNVSSITLVGTTATVTSNAHGYSNGDVITIWGATPVNYNGSAAISNVTANTFDYTTVSGLTSPAVGEIQCTKSNSFSHGGARVLWSVLTTKETCIFGINLIDKNAWRNVYDVTVNGLYGYINDWLILREVRGVPPVNLLTSGAIANERDRMALFMVNNKWVAAYNNAGTSNYAVLDLDGSDTAWSNSATAP